jgi:hypothetical protein
MLARSFRRPIFFCLTLALSVGTLLPMSASASTITGYISRQAQTAARGTQPYRVALQIGHYKNNELPPELSSLSGHTGAYGGGRSEVSVNLDVANRVAALLRPQGVTVEILPATVPSGYTADAFVALHADGNPRTSTRGFKISTRWRSEVAVQDIALVEMLTESYRAATGLPEDGGVTRNMRGYYAYSPWRPNWRVSNYTPGAIVEMGFMTNAADREVMFKATDKVASGIAKGIMQFLKSAYGSPRAARSYGHGIADPTIVLNAPAFPQQRTGGSSGGPPRTQTGDWQLYLMGKQTINAYDRAGGGAVVAQLTKGRAYHSTLRQGDYYRITLPNGKEGWVHRNAIVVQM